MVDAGGFGDTHFSMAIYTPEIDSTLMITESQNPAFYLLNCRREDAFVRSRCREDPAAAV
jgi:hypothetical protein